MIKKIIKHTYLILKDLLHVALCVVVVYVALDVALFTAQYHNGFLEAERYQQMVQDQQVAHSIIAKEAEHWRCESDTWRSNCIGWRDTSEDFKALFISQKAETAKVSREYRMSQGNFDYFVKAFQQKDPEGYEELIKYLEAGGWVNPW